MSSGVGGGGGCRGGHRVLMSGECLLDGRHSLVHDLFGILPEAADVVLRTVRFVSELGVEVRGFFTDGLLLDGLGVEGERSSHNG